MSRKTCCCALSGRHYYASRYRPTGRSPNCRLGIPPHGLVQPALTAALWMRSIRLRRSRRGGAPPGIDDRQMHCESCWPEIVLNVHRRPQDEQGAAWRDSARGASPAAKSTGLASSAVALSARPGAPTPTAGPPRYVRRAGGRARKAAVTASPRRPSISPSIRTAPSPG